MQATTERVALVLLAAGASRRMGVDKLLLRIAGETPIARCAQIFAACGVGFCETVVTVSESTRAEAAKAFPEARLVRGGETRGDSVRRALAALTQADIVVIHDAARCMTPPEVIRASIQSAAACGSGVAAIRARDTVRYRGAVLERDEVLLAQTPQTFELKAIREAYARGCEATDDAAVYALAGHTPHFTPGSVRNQKLTLPEDIPLFEALCGKERLCE